MKKYSVTYAEFINTIAQEVADKVDEKIYRILSGKFKLRKDGELDMRFKDNYTNERGLRS